MFRDRKDAGIQLGKALQSYPLTSPIVLGIPRGGMETAYEVARALKTRAFPVIARKLGFPQNPEFAMGAIAEDGSLYLSPLARQEVNESTLQSILAKEKIELLRRIRLFRGKTALPSLKGKTVLLVDDGIATGATLFATIQLCKKQNPKKLIVAAPICAPDTLKEVRALADETIVLEIPEDFQSVSQGYASFPSLSDEETLHFLPAPHPRQKLPMPRKI